MTKRKKKSFIKNSALAIILGAALLIGTPASAATSGTTKASQAITGGTRDISVSATTTFSAVTLDGTTQTATANPGSLALQDNTGSGAGWRVSVQASQFTEKAPVGGFQSGTVAQKLPTGSLKLVNTGASITQNGTTSGVPTWTGTTFTLDGGAAVNLLSAPADAGMGKYTVALGANSLSLTLLPASTYVDSINYSGVATPYESTLTYSIIAGP